MTSTSTLQEIRSTAETRLRVPAAPTIKLRYIGWYFRTRSKKAWQVSSDWKEIDALQQNLNRAIEELGVRSLLSQNLCLYSPHAPDCIIPSRGARGG
jgi:hypothetical protein